MARVIGWDHRSFAGARDERPAVVGVEVVVVGAERVELVDAGAFRFGPFRVVVVLEPSGAGAALDRATR